MKVLVVDDSQMSRMVASNALKNLGVTDIVEAEDGVEALQAFKSDDFDVVFSDWNMPNKSGIELLADVRKLSPDVPFILITTEGSKKAVMQAMQLKVSDYLAKPFTPSALTEKLKKWVAPAAPV